MSAYHYIALNQEQKELSGVIEAGDETTARSKLNSLGLSIVSIKTIESAIHDEKAKKIVFEFEGFDKNGKRVSGTIASKDALSAYTRLRDEYLFNVISLVSATLDQKEKQAAVALGIDSLVKEYEKWAQKTKKKVTEEDSTNVLAEQRKELLEKVDITMKRIEIFLKEFGPDIKNEEKNTIQSYLNQLFRIKDSTNLEHIKTTCEKMLSYIQQQELFMNEELKLKESSKIKVETSELLQSLKQTGIKKEIDIVDTIAKFEKYAYLKPFAVFALRLLGAENLEARKLKKEIKNVNQHIFEYVKILVLGKTKAIKTDAWQSILALRQEKHRLKMQLRAIIIEEKRARRAGKPESQFFENAAVVMGWILAFYLLSYIVAYPFTIKKFDFISTSLPNSFYFYKTNLTKIATLFLFLFFSAAQIRNFWLRESQNTTVAVHAVMLFGFLLTLINLL